MAVRLSAFLIVPVLLFAALATPAPAQDSATAVGRGSYTPSGKESRQDTVTLAAFEASLDAVSRAAAVLRGREEIFDMQGWANMALLLSADRAQKRIVKEACPSGNATCRVEVEAVLTLKDFVQAEEEAAKMRKAASREGFRAEMEPTLAAEFNPAEALAWAGAEMSLGRLRPAVLYLDKLLGKYPNWTSALLSRAKAYRAMNLDDRAKADLRKACELGSKPACARLK